MGWPWKEGQNYKKWAIINGKGQFAGVRWVQSVQSGQWGFKHTALAKHCLRWVNSLSQIPTWMLLIFFAIQIPYIVLSLPHFDKFLPIIDATRGGPLLIKLKKVGGEKGGEICDVWGFCGWKKHRKLIFGLMMIDQDVFGINRVFTQHHSYWRGDNLNQSWKLRN